MITPFTMPPPNELLNEQHISLDEILYPYREEDEIVLNPVNGHGKGRKVIHIKRRIVCHHAAVKHPESELLLSPSLWHGRLFTSLCFQDEPLIAALIESAKLDWALPSRNKIAVRLKNLFEKYLLHHSFYLRQWNTELFEPRDAERFNSLYVPLTLEQTRAAKQSFERCVTIVTQWAMCDFSRRRSDWALVGEAATLHAARMAEVPNIAGHEISDELSAARLAERRRKNRMAVFQREADSPALTAAPVVPSVDPKLKKLKREVARLRRLGLLTDEKLEGLDESIPWKGDYADG